LPPEDKTRQYTKDEVISGGRSYFEGDLRFNPGTVIYIGVDHVFDDPTFDLACDVPCRITRAMLVTRYDESSTGVEGIHPNVKSTADGLYQRISVIEKLGPAPNSAIELHIRSTTDQPVVVSGVVSSADNL
jgi:hypothetical protein